MAALWKWLLVFTLLMHALLATTGQQYDFDGSGDSDGSTDDDERCIEPDPRILAPDGNVNVRETELKCQLACIEKISALEGSRIEVSTDYPGWPMYRDSDLEMNCTIYQMVYECRRGCTANNCRRKCGSCKDCDEENEDCNANCYPIICDPHMCDLGCIIQDELKSIENDSLIPPAPEGPLTLTIPVGSEVAGLYNMDAHQSIPTAVDNTTRRYPTGFLVRVKGEETRGYIWMTDFEGLLKLGHWACEEVLLNFAAVNKFGSTAFTLATATPANVYGENPPTSPTNPEPVFDIEADGRPGYWKHAVITIAWYIPLKGYELFEEYNITFKLLEGKKQPYCKEKSQQHFVISKEFTTFTIQADSPLEGPVSDCKYTVKVFSVPKNTNISATPAMEHLVHVNSSVTNPVPLNFSCERTWQEEKGLFTYSVGWKVPVDRNVMRAISSFNLTFDLTSSSQSSGAELIDSTEFPFNMSQSDFEYHYEYRVGFHKSPNRNHRIMMTTGSADTSYIVLVPAVRSCTFPAQAVPPPQIDIHPDNLTTATVQQNGGSLQLELEVVWNPVPVGSVHYQLRLVEQETFHDKPIGFIYTHSIGSGDTKVSLKTSLPPKIDSPCIYFQIRAISRHDAAGNWSHPVCIDLPQVPTPNLPNSLSVRNPQPTSGLGPSKDGSGPSLSEVIYIVVSVFLAIVIIIIFTVALVLCLVITQKQKAGKRSKRLRANTFISRKVIEKDRYNMVKLDKWEIYSNQVAVQTPLGEGAFGNVHRGLFNSSITDKSKVKISECNSVPVAVKLLRDDASDRDREVFLRHIIQAKKIAQYPNVHLVCMLGCVTEEEPLSLLTEFPEKGDLLTYLRAQRYEIYRAQLQQLDYPDCVVVPQNSSGQSLQAADLMLFISHVAAGLEHLASIGVVHGDVACRNLFLTADRVIKIADFGLDSTLAEEKDLVYMQSESGRLPIRWMAIESTRDGEFSTASDVWAFGITLWEIASLGGFPYHDTANIDILATLSAGQRLECPSNCSEEIYGIMLKCCAAMPSDRPSFSTLHNVFRSLHSTSNSAEYITLNINSASPYYLASPRSSTTESQIETDECTLLVDSSTSPKPMEIVVHSSHTTHSYHSHPPPKVPVEHSRSASYACSDSGFLPCIEEEKEEEEEDSDTEEDQEKGATSSNENRDSGNVSTSSHESLKENNSHVHTHERDNSNNYSRENSDEAVVMDDDKMDGMELI